MKCCKIFSIVLLTAAVTFADIETGQETVEAFMFGIPGLRPQQANGTVSEHIPYMASLRMVNQENSEKFGYGHFCGGVFVSRSHILTVASCVSRSFQMHPDEIVVIAGTRYRYDETDAEKYEVDKFVIHPDYVVTQLPNNLAIIYLKEAVSSDFRLISSVKIAEETVQESQKLQIFGWGTPLIDNGQKEIQTGGITVLDRNICEEQSVNRFCAGPSFYGGCEGDDGGAVAADNKLYGLIDYRPPSYCSVAHPAHLYVDVTAYREWILETINFGSKSTESMLLIAFVSVAQFLFIFN